MSNAVSLDGPVLWNLAQERNPHFAGRDALLSELRQRFVAGQSVQAITGLGGVGKTQAAAEYAYRHRNDYAIIWWIKADAPAGVHASLYRLVTALGRPLSENAPSELIRDAVRGVLARRQALLIFDGANDPQTIRPFLSSDAHVIITSRNSRWGDIAHGQPLRVLDRADAMLFLQNRTGRNESDTITEKLAHALGDLPLALEQAAVCIVQLRLSFAEYLARFETQWAELLQIGLKPVDYPHTVAMTWGLSFNAVQAESPAAIDLMNFCSFLCPDQISQQALRDGREHLPPRLKGLFDVAGLFEQAVGHLLNYSLVESNGQNISLHRLVAIITRDRLDDNDQLTWCNAAVKFIAGSFSFDSTKVETWHNCPQWVPHVMQATAHAERLDTMADSCIDLLNDTGRYLLRVARFPEAKEAMVRAMRICRRRYGQEHPKLSSIANNLGRVIREMGDDDSAIALFQQAMSIDQTAYGADHPHVAEVLNNFGMCLHRKGDIQGAKDQFERAAHICENRDGVDAPQLARILNNLGYVLMNTGDIENARVQMLRALTIAEMSLGEDHPTVARILCNLAAIHRTAKEFPLAKEHLEHVLMIDTAALGPDHPEVGRDCAAMAELLELMGGPTDTAEYYRQRAQRIADTGGG